MILEIMKEATSQWMAILAFATPYALTMTIGTSLLALFFGFISGRKRII